MLILDGVSVEVAGKEILHDISMEVEPGKTHVLFGPNGTGKTTLLMTIMGFSGYKVTKGKIFYKGEDITKLPLYERARMGIGMSFQRPPTIRGLKTRQLVALCA
ncbi:MAG: ATP-binding cassette domain-containing protein, partial [Deltaproteobacteria bacterium]|nr:ATP-binding cassette domain-containing protein [Deltaproteobacteria bacterium]